tara:strand:+ start:806 stop:2590 length:1785 start_codon:yes stop_codon:yes gene_type:complete
MAYSVQKKNNGNGRVSTNNNQADIQLSINTPEGDYLCQSLKNYTEKASIVQDLDQTDSFIKLSSFSKNFAALTVHNAKAIVIKNISNVATELCITYYDWRNDGGADAASDTTTDVHNSVDMNEENGSGEETAVRMMSWLLPSGDFLYLPNTRMVGYAPYTLSDGSTTPESAANSPAGAVAIEPKDIASGAEIIPIHLFSGTTYNSGADLQVTEDVALAETAIDVDDGNWFEVGDLIAIGTEIMEVESISSNTLTVKRGLLGSTEATHSDDDDLNFFIGNEYLAFDNGKCQTDQNGKFKQRGAFFSYGRTADEKIKGVVPGSVAIGPFYTEGGYLDWGLQNIKASDKTGLAASTTYTFHIVVDEYNVGGIDSVSTETIIAFTTDASDTTWAGSSNAVLPKIQAVFDEEFYVTASSEHHLQGKKVTIGLHNGDVRVQSHSNHSETRVGIANVSGTTPFGVGRFPALSSSVPVLLGSTHGGGTTDNIVFGPASTLAKAEIEDPVSNKTIPNTNAFLFDDGNGNLLHNGTKVGSIDYARGHCEFTHLPNAEFKVYAETLAAHSGGVQYLANAYNSIDSIRGRSVNPVADSKVEVLLLG